MQCNRDLGTAGTPFIFSSTSSIVTSNTTHTAGLTSLNRTPTTQAVYLDISGDAGTPSMLTVSSISVGDGGMIVVDAAPHGPTSSNNGPEAGQVIQWSGTSLNAGVDGTVVLDGVITAATAGDAIGSQSVPISVLAGTVVATTNFGNIWVSDSVAGTFAATTTELATGQTATTGGPSINLSTSSGDLTVGGMTSNVAGGAIDLTGAGNVVVNAPLGSSTTGAINIDAGNNVLFSSAQTFTSNEPVRCTRVARPRKSLRAVLLP